MLSDSVGVAAFINPQLDCMDKNGRWIAQLQLCELACSQCEGTCSTDLVCVCGNVSKKDVVTRLFFSRDNMVKTASTAMRDSPKSRATDALKLIIRGTAPPQTTAVDAVRRSMGSN